MKSAKSFLYNFTVALVLIISIIFASINFASAATIKSVVDNMDGNFSKLKHTYMNLSDILTLPDGGEISNLSQLGANLSDDTIKFIANPASSASARYYVDGAGAVKIGFYTTFSLKGYGSSNIWPGNYFLEKPQTGENYEELPLHNHNGNLLIKCLNDEYFRQVTVNDGNIVFSSGHYSNTITVESGETTPLGAEISAVLKDGSSRRIIPGITSSTMVVNSPFGPIYYHEARADLSEYDLKNIDFTLTGYDHLTDGEGRPPYSSIFGFEFIEIEDVKIQGGSSSSSEGSSGESEGSSGSSSSESESSGSSSSKPDPSSESESSGSSSSKPGPSSESESSGSSSSKPDPSSESESSGSSSSSSTSYSSSEIEILFPSMAESVSSEEKSSSSTLESSKLWEKDLALPDKSSPSDKEGVWDDSLLIIDADIKEDVSEFVTDNQENPPSAIDKETPEITPFVPILPPSIINSEKPTVEKVVGSSLIVSASIGIYVIFYKKMMAL